MRRLLEEGAVVDFSLRTRGEKSYECSVTGGFRRGRTIYPCISASCRDFSHCVEGYLGRKFLGSRPGEDRGGTAGAGFGG